MGAKPPDRFLADRTSPRNVTAVLTRRIIDERENAAKDIRWNPLRAKNALRLLHFSDRLNVCVINVLCMRGFTDIRLNT